VTPLDEPLSIRSLLDGAVRQARRHWRAIYPAVAIPMALIAASLPFAQGLWLRDFPRAGAAPPDMSRFFTSMGAIFGVSMIFMAVYLLAHAAMTAGAVDAMAGRQVSMGRAWRSILQPRALGTFALVYPAIFIGMMCCVVPGLYLSLLWSLIVPVMVEERRFLIDGLGRSSDLARYNPRRELSADPRVRAFLVYLVGTLVLYAVSFVVQLPFMVVQQVMLFRGMAGGERIDPLTIGERLIWLQVPTSIIASLAQMAVQLVVSFGIALLYFDVRRRKEGRDLEHAVDGLVRAPPPAADGGA
jgi:hypothetical protein